jgi:hypothetical protein
MKYGLERGRLFGCRAERFLQVLPEYILVGPSVGNVPGVSMPDTSGAVEIID